MEETQGPLKTNVWIFTVFQSRCHRLHHRSQRINPRQCRTRGLGRPNRAPPALQPVGTAARLQQQAQVHLPEPVFNFPEQHGTHLLEESRRRVHQALIDQVLLLPDHHLARGSFLGVQVQHW